MAIKSAALLLFAFALLVAQMAITSANGVQAHDCAPASAPVAAPVYPPVTYPPVTSYRGRYVRCLKYCSSSRTGKRVCFRICTACAAKYMCVPLDMECKKWSYGVQIKGKLVKCP